VPRVYIENCIYLCLRIAQEWASSPTFWQRYNLFLKEKRFFIEMLFLQGLQGFVPFRMAQYTQQNLKISNLKTKIHFGFKISSKLINIIILYLRLLESLFWDLRFWDFWQSIRRILSIPPAGGWRPSLQWLTVFLETLHQSKFGSARKKLSWILVSCFMFQNLKLYSSNWKTRTQKYYINNNIIILLLI